MSFISSSQIIPKVHIEQRDTSFCFTITQSKFIAKKLVALNYCDSISISQDTIISHLQNTINTQKEMLSIAKEKENNNLLIIRNNEVITEGLKNDLVAEKKKFKKKRWYWLGAGVLGGFMAGVVLVH